MTSRAVSSPVPLSPRVPELGALELLVALARVGSLGRAAKVLGVTQQAASARIRRTERLLGMALIERSRRGSRLTSEGALVVEWAEEVVEGARAFGHSVDALRVRAHGHLTVAASMTVGEFLVPRWLVMSRRERPDVAINLAVRNSTEVARQVVDRTSDVGFIESPALPPDVHSQTIREDALCVVVGRAHAWAQARSGISAEELGSTPLIQRECGSGTRATLQRALQAARSTAAAPPLLELGSNSEIKTALLEGGAAAVLSRLAVARELRDGSLVAVSTPELDLTRTLRAIWPTGTSLLGPARGFVALACRAEAGLPASVASLRETAH